MSIKLKHSGGNSVSLNPPTSAPTSSDVAFKLPNADGSSGQALKTDGSGNLSFGGTGITEFDHYYLTSNWTTSGDALMTSWARVTTSVAASSASPLGSGVSHSSGTFSFPSTGKYLVIVNGVFEIVSDDHIYILVKVTQNNSSYVTYGTATDGNGGSATRNGSGTAFVFIDVTDTSNVKVRFHADSISSGSNISGPINAYVPVQTSLFFIRIGDT